MAYIDVNKPVPGGVEGIMSLIGNYSSPQVAEQDFNFNAPQSRDYLEKQYQDLTGNPFSNPFKDANDRQYDAVMQAAMSGASVATGSNTGPSAFRSLRSSAPSVVSSTAPDAPNAHGSIPGASAHPDALDSSPEYSLSMATNPADYGQRITRRLESIKHPLVKQIMSEIGGTSGAIGAATTAGVGSGAGEYGGAKFGMGVEGATASQDLVDPKTGKPIATSQLDPDLLNSKSFRFLMQQDRPVAAQVYHAKTGRDLERDINSNIAAEVAQKAARGDVLSGLRNLEINKTTGKKTITRSVKNPLSATGEMMEVQTDLSDFQQAVLDKEGGTMGKFGFDIGPHGIPKGMDAEAGAEFTKRRNARIAAGQDKDEAYYAAWNELHGEVNAKKTPVGSPNARSTTNHSEEGPLGALSPLGMMRPRDIGAPWLNLLGGSVNAIKSQVNLPLRVSNAASSAIGGSRIPLIPDIPLMSVGEPMTRQEMETRNEVMRRIAEMMGMARSGFVGE